MTRGVHAPYGASLQERLKFYSTPRKNGCIEWTAHKIKEGYGRISHAGKRVLVHRAAWAIKNGEAGEMDVLHKCDNPACINTDHLFLGTHQENMADRNRKGRQARLRGELSGAAVLSEADVLSIRNSSLSRAALQEQYGVSKACIQFVISRRTWRHI